MAQNSAVLALTFLMAIFATIQQASCTNGPRSKFDSLLQSAEAARGEDSVAAEAQTAAQSIVQQPANTSGTAVVIAPFGREDTAAELQNHAARTQDTLVDAVENAEVAEIKRAVFRALTRLRAAEIKEFDTIARLETQAIDEYNDNHHFRAENPLDYLSSAEPAVVEDKYTSFHS
mmetsp:Transcript_58194/g.138573  ORF Transcript_58194/g.138573 Transcript_58194/m.138573 type:complete len:175 (+) Transcript_58194:99-623(+)